MTPIHAILAFLPFVIVLTAGLKSSDLRKCGNKRGSIRCFLTPYHCNRVGKGYVGHNLARLKLMVHDTSKVPPATMDELFETIFSGLKPVAYLAAERAAKLAALEANTNQRKSLIEKGERYLEEDVEAKGPDDTKGSPSKNENALTNAETAAIFGSAEDQGCIMASPELKMSIPLIDMDIERHANQLLEAAADPPSTRWKMYYAAIRGKGTGKTRLFEELRRHLLVEREGVLCIAISFGNKTPWGSVEESWRISFRNSRQGNNLYRGNELVFALALVSRMASSFFGIDCKTADGLINRNMEAIMALANNRDVKSWAAPEEEVISSLVRLMVAKMKEQNRTAVHTFVLLIDDLNPPIVEGYYESMLLSQSFLNRPISPDLGTTFAVSGWSKDMAGRLHLTARRAFPLELAAQLNITRVVDEVWGQRTKLTSQRDRLKLQLLAAMVNRVPLLVEIVRNFIINDNEDSMSNSYLTDIFTSLEQGWRQHYEEEYFPPTGDDGEPYSPDRLLDTVCKAVQPFKLVVEDEVDERRGNVAAAMKSSLLTNQLISAQLSGGNSNVEYVFYPELSLMMLYHWARTARAAYHLLEEGNGISSDSTPAGPHDGAPPSVYSLDAIIQSVETIIKFIKDDHPSQNTCGGVAEHGLTSAIVLREWLQVRVATTEYQQRTNHDVFTAANLLGFREPWDLSMALKRAHPDLIPFFEDKIKLRKNGVGKSNFNQVHRLATSSYTDRDAFLEELEGVAMTPILTQQEAEVEDERYGGVAVILPCNSAPPPNTDDSSTVVAVQRPEAWDLCLKIFSSSSAQPVYVFIDSTSRIPIDASAAMDDYRSPRRSFEHMPDDALLYKHTRDVLEGSDIPYLYLYACRANGTRSSFSAQRAIVLGDVGLRRLLGPMQTVYEML